MGLTTIFGETSYIYLLQGLHDDKKHNLPENRWSNFVNNMDILLLIMMSNY